MKPFLKWAGNKYKLCSRIKTILPAGKRLIEPFLGAGALFLNTDYPEYLLNDTNTDLIQLYLYLQKEGLSFIQDGKKFFEEKNNNKVAFYEFRTLFNETRDTRLKSLLFIYLNRHCFNGLCRYNNSGLFNTPFGLYKNPYYPEKEMIFFYEQAQKAIFKCQDFTEIMESAETGDIVYCDPPYVPLSKTANFTSYGTDGFNAEQQMILATQAEKLAARGITVIISNHDTPETQQLYNNAQTIHSFDVKRTISCIGKNRGKAPEILAVF